MYGWSPKRVSPRAFFTSWLLSVMANRALRGVKQLPLEQGPRYIVTKKGSQNLRQRLKLMLDDELEELLTEDSELVLLEELLDVEELEELETLDELM